MNNSTFRNKETLIYRLPAAILDLLLMIAVYKLMLLAFPVLVEADKVIASKRSVYFLIVGHLVACIFVPVRFYQRKLSLRAVFQNSFFHCLVCLTGNTAEHTNAGSCQSHPRTAADTAADKSIGI